MKLSNKVLITFSVIWIIFLGIVYIIGYQYFMRSYLNIEKSEIEKNVNRYHQYVNEILHAQGAQAVDWGYWNDAYEYLENKNKDFIDHNIDYSTLANLSINLVLYVNTQGKIIYGTGADYTKEALVPYTKDIEKYLSPDSVLVKHTDPIKSFTGLVNLPSGLMLIAAAPVSYSLNGVTKPINGAVIVGRYFSQDLLDKTAKAISIPLLIYTVNHINGNTSLSSIFQFLIANNKNYIDLVNSQTAHVYTLFRDINQKPIGMVELFVSRDIYNAGVKATNYYLTIFLTLGFISGILIWFLLKSLVLIRLEDLNKKIMKISESKDYRHRIEVSYHDEISYLAKHFNHMMQTIQHSHGQLSHQVQLLQESEMQLEKLNATLKEEINERKLAEEKISALQSKLLLAARRAGMADIANGVLHNVGNILNSVATSIGVIRERSSDDKITKVEKIVDLLLQQNDIGKFFSEDPKAKNIPNYLSMIAKSLQEDKNLILDEILILDKNIDVIKNVVTSQQSASESIGIVEKVNLANLIDDALSVNKFIYEKSDIKIIRDYDDNKTILIDRVKLLHIIVNFIKNGIESVLSNNNNHKVIIIRTENVDVDHIMIQVEDNGIGIIPEHLDKIFSFGFTTKKTGHGFGMHTSANFAGEINGRIFAESKGLNKGALMTLILPITPEKKTADVSKTELPSSVPS